jgi:TldD protein
VKDFPQSNGHGRAGIAGGPRPSIGVLKVTAQDGLTDEELNKKLLDMAKDRGLKSVYYVADDGRRDDAEAALSRECRRHARTGARRGARRIGPAGTALEREAAGKDLWLANYDGDVPQTVLAPALLLDDVTVKRANEKNDKLPFYPPPGE